jgi:hypothetical protein
MTIHKALLVLGVSLGVVAGAFIGAVAFVAMIDTVFPPFPLGPEGLSGSAYNAGTGTE